MAPSDSAIAAAAAAFVVLVYIRGTSGNSSGVFSDRVGPTDIMRRTPDSGQGSVLPRILYATGRCVIESGDGSVTDDPLIDGLLGSMS